MKNLVFVFFLLPLLCFSQKTEKNKLSFDITGGVYSNFKNWKENGITGGYEISLNRKSIVYSANIIIGLGLSKNRINNDGYLQAFLESDLLIGKEFNLSKSISIQPQIGIGYLHYTNHFQTEKKHLIGLPIQTKIIFFNQNDVSVGLIPRVNLNNTQNNYSLLFTVNIKS